MVSDGWEICQSWAGRAVLLAVLGVLCVSFVGLYAACLRDELRDRYLYGRQRPDGR